MIVQEDQYLAHYGVKGMKWGVRKAIDNVKGKIQAKRKQELEYRQKLKNINAKNKNKADDELTFDEKRIRYRDQHIVQRAGQVASMLVIKELITDFMSGESYIYSSMSKKEIAKKIGKLTALTALNVKVQDSLADSSAKKYNNEGKRIKKNRLIEKEDLIDIGVTTAIMAAPLIKNVAQTKLSKVVAEKQANKDRFDSWKGNILTEKASNYNNIWTSADGNTSILEKVR